MEKIQERHITCSEKETQKLGERLSKTFKPGDSVCLEGDLGAGKTALVKGIAKGLGIADTITSPTFTLVNTYEGDVALHHFDVYRINDPEELYEIGWEEYFNPGAICIVEWGDRVKEMLPPEFIRIRVNRDEADPDKREIIVERRADKQ